MVDEVDNTEGAITRLDEARRKKQRTQAATALVARWAELDLMLTPQSKPYCNAENARRIVAHDSLLASSVWFDAEAQRLMAGERAWSDADDIEFLARIQCDYGIPRMAILPVRQGIELYGRANPRSPLTDWLNTLAWDGTARLQTWLADAYGCPQSDYSAAVGHCWLVSLAARAFKPGCQVDTMIVLEGEQGVRKSTSLEILGGAWYRAITQPFGSKEWIEAIIGGVWVAEVADLSGFRGRDLDHLKAALTTRVDHFRRSYGHHAMDYPRRPVFAGTTNRDDWQADDTGARRFLPVKVREVNLEYISTQREQLLAEAVQRYKAGESWWDTPTIEVRQELEARRDSDVWEESIGRYLEARTEVTVAELLRACLEIEPERQDKRAQMRVASALRVLGFVRVLRREGTTRVRVWCRGGSTADLFGGGSK